MPNLSFVAVLVTALSLFTGGGLAERAAAVASAPAPAVTRPADGAPSVPSPPPVIARRVDIEMKDIAFLPPEVDVKLGETVTFVFTNTGRMVHDAFIGDEAAQQQHEKEMRENPEGHDHAHTGGVTVPPGETGAVRYFFDKPGTFEIGCHQVGHYTYGMKAIINVSPV